MKISVIGSGYVGLVTGVCLSDFGNHVTCIDQDQDKIANLQKGKSPIYEPGLTSLIRKNQTAKRLVFTTDLSSILDSQVIFIAVGTPAKETGEADTQYITAAYHQLIALLKKAPSNQYRVIVNKSTVPVGTAAQATTLFREHGLTPNTIELVSNPEFLREGSAINDFMRPDRIVVGSTSEKALNILTELYRPFYLIETPIIKTNLETAELIKYASNAFLATKISFINEMANLCDLVGADVKFVSKGMGSDNRIGRYFLHPGPGYGGSCFPKDTQALVHLASKHQYDLKLVKATEAVNALQKQKIVEKIKHAFPDTLQNKTFGLLGLSFKPNTDDIRESPALSIIHSLQKEGAKIKAFDPIAMKNCQKHIGNIITYAESAIDAITGTDGLILATEWNEFRELDLTLIKQHIGQPYIFDCRNVFAPQKVIDHGFTYVGIGR